jgi:hypothetical protein
LPAADFVAFRVPANPDVRYEGDFRQHIHAWTEDLELLRQNTLLSESVFV